MSDRPSGPIAAPASLRAVLGPTNTGKTHLALERLLGHESGIIGFPLRLLARENYDRMAARMGAHRVALITGEEKIVPPGARWFSCTVEAMPLDRPAAFVAIDEIQLCADPDRGHIFTDRLLHARGRVETMFLGAETIRPLLRRLVPGAQIETRPRLSRLAYAGPAKLSRLPARAAVVAFTAAEVYAIAEAIRRRRGGCAVVMGRLSPRTRNAQVAMYQAKEVDFLVATDAIGMGLNMDVDHVAFAALSKFDGRRPRALAPAEVAQIAGRAGRGMRDGTFGVTADCPPMPPGIVEPVENHRFDPLPALYWRNGALDFRSLDALLAALDRPPPAAGLVRGPDATDHITLAALARDEEIVRLVRAPAALRLLWDPAQIPDYRKLGDDSHPHLCAVIFRHLTSAGECVPTDFVARHLEALDRTDGDIDTLMARLAGVRTWAFIAQRPGWIAEATHFAERARAIEDAISDALHAQLMARFVDRRAAHLIRKLEGDAEALVSAVARDGSVIVEGHRVGALAGLGFAPEPDAAAGEHGRTLMRAARRALAEAMPRHVAQCIAAPDSAFAVSVRGRITWDGAEIARLKPGPSLLRPLIEPAASEYLDGAARERVRARLAAWLDAQLARQLAPLFALDLAAAEAAPALRGIAHLLVEHGGSLPRGEAEAALGALDAAGRARLKALGVRTGRHAVFLPALLKPRAMGLRALLWAVAHRLPAPPALPAPGLVSAPADPAWPGGFALAAGWLVLGPHALRLDVAERLAAELAFKTRAKPQPLPEALASRLGCRAEAMPAILRALGFRLAPGDGGVSMLHLLRPRRRPQQPRPGRGKSTARPPAPAPVPPPAPGPGGAFAALARLKLRAR